MNRLTFKALVAYILITAWISPANAIELVNDGIVTGAISTPGESDEYTLDASAGEVMHIRVVETVGSIEPEVWLYNPDGTLNTSTWANTTVAFDCFAGSSNCTLPQTGTYRLVVADHGNGDTGSYEIHLARVLASNENGALVNDDVVTSDITVGDIDTFVFDASAGEVMHIRVVETVGSIEPEVWLYNPDGTLNTSTSANTTVAFDCFAGSSNCTLPQTGTYRLVVADHGNGDTGSYEIHLARVLASNENGALVNDDVVTSDITVGDIDTFVFDASAGEVMHIRVVETVGSIEPEVWLYNPDGTLNTSTWANTTVAFDCFAGSSNCTLPQTGTYRLVLADHGNVDTGSYEIHLARVLASNENGALVNDDVVTSDITVGDIDTFVFDASAGEVMHIRVVETVGSIEPEVWLYNPDGTLNTSTSANTTVAFDCFAGSSNCTLPQTGTYRLVVADHGNGDTGSYEIHLARVLASNENGALVNDDVVTSDITVGDIDTFVFDASAGEVMHIRVVETVGSIEPEVWLYNPDGTLNTYTWANTTVAFDCSAGSNNCTLPQTGTYRLVLADHGNVDTGSYEISFSGSPQFTLSNDTPYWDNRAPAGPAVQLRWTLSSYGTDYEVYRDGVKIYPTSGIFTERSFRNEIGLTPGQTYSYYIMANNSQGANKTNTISVGPMPGEPIAPTVAAISPNEIVQGNSYKDVVITGTDLTSSSWHQFSIDGGVSWAPAQSAPTINGATSITAGVNNTIARTVLIRVCASHGSAACSASMPVTIQATASEIAPKVTNVLPSAIAQGGGSQNVTLTGVAFSTANRYQQSINGGNWVWASSVPTVNNSTSMTVAVDDPAQGKVRIRVCDSQGSSACSESVGVTVGSVPTVAPAIDSISLDTIPEGANYQNVTLSGSDFTALSFHQFSVDDGATWQWAQVEPKISVPDSMTIKVNNTEASALLIRVCESYGSSQCSASNSITIQQPEQRTENQQQPGQLPTRNDNAILITHGWNSNAASWVLEMAKAICIRLNGGQEPVYTSLDANAQTQKSDPLATTLICQVGNWDVWIGDWRKSAATVLPSIAWIEAGILGEEFGLSLVGYKHVHFIAHSAGSKLIDLASGGFRSWTRRLLAQDNIEIHATFLDPFDPGAEGMSTYGEEADWSDNYVDTRRLDQHTVFSEKSYNFEITPAPGEGNIDDCLIDWTFGNVCAHSRPYRYYGLSVTGIDVQNPYVGDPAHVIDDPIESTGNNGYPLSLENGNSLQLLKDIYPIGEKCIMGGGVCFEDQLPPTYDLWYRSTTPLEPLLDANDAAIDFVKGTAGKILDWASLTTNNLLSGANALFALTQADTSSSSDEPAYLVAQLVTSIPSNQLRFDWAFDVTGEGLLQVFVNGELVRQIDQRYVTQASTESEEVYIGGVDGTLPPGTQEIAFRLDGFGANPSHLELTNVEIGLRQAVDADGIHVIPYGATLGGVVSPNTPQLVTTGQTTSFTVIASEGYTRNLEVGGDCLQGGWIGDTWSTGAINASCSVSFSFDLLDTDSDAIPNLEDIDDDDDGLSDSEETALGTDPLNFDTDGDGFSDGEEVAAGSNPLNDASVPAFFPDGDINDDGRVDVSDLVLAMRILNGQYIPTQEEQDRWDVAPLVNGVPEPNQENNLGDYLILQRKVMGFIDF